MAAIGKSNDDVKAILGALHGVVVPGVHEVAAMIASVEVSDGVVSITLRYGFGVDVEALTLAMRSAVMALDGIASVEITLPSVAVEEDEGPSLNQLEGRGYAGPVPVFQWEIDPTDPLRVCGSVNATEGDWEFSIWWQLHPADLVYASIEARRSADADGYVSAGGDARLSHQAVQLVYDRRRRGVVSLHGPAADFRPFVLAFVKAYGARALDDEPAEA